jgi:hypothetical protein
MLLSRRTQARAEADVRGFMAELSTGLEHSLQIPDDLREWVEARELVALVLAAVHETEELVEDGPRLPAGEARLLVNVMTYSYAVGIYSSEDIELRAIEDPEVAYLSGRYRVSSVALRQFRRHYRAFLQRGLCRLFQRVCQTRGGGSDSHDQDTALVLLAEGRINRSVLADTMALDN